MPESQNIEYKTNWRDEYLKWICGFANANGGKLYIGIDDKGKLTGIDNHKKLLEELPLFCLAKTRANFIRIWLSRSVNLERLMPN